MWAEPLASACSKLVAVLSKAFKSNFAQVKVKAGGKLNTNFRKTQSLRFEKIVDFTIA